MAIDIEIPRNLAAPGYSFTRRTVVVIGKDIPAPGLQNLKGTLTKVGGTTVVGNPKIRRGKGFWSMVFKNVPMDRDTNPPHQFVPTAYTLTVTATGQPNAVRHVQVVPGKYALDIEDPLDDQDVDPTFYTWGTTTELTQPSASVTAPEYSVTFLFGPPDNPVYWAFEFADVTQGDWTLHVQAGQSSDQRSIHVI